MLSSFRVRSLFVLLCLASRAEAGPIDWTYTSRFSAAGQPDVPFIDIADGGAPGSRYVLEASLQGLIEAGKSANPGSSPIVLGHFAPALFPIGPGQAPTTATTFELDVTITDQASGLSGTASFFGFGSTVVNPVSTPNPVSLQFLTPTSKTLVLGENDYELSLTSTSASWGGNGDVVAAVSIRPAATPEPGALALAGFGFVGLLGWRNRNRFTASRRRFG